MRRLAALLLLLSLALNACEKKNPNYDPPPPYDDSAVGTHKFDGGATDPYAKGTDGGDSGDSSDQAPKGGEAKGGDSQ
jgi:hypothetical protein